MRNLRAFVLGAVCLATWPACGFSSGPPKRPMAPEEESLRTKLGVPRDAQLVVVFGQSSHLDVDWQKTFDDYYASYVENIFLSARKLLDAQPRAYYGIAEMAFLEEHLARHPEEAGPLRDAVARGQLHIVGGSMTSPDTLVPETELLARDALFGISFAEGRLGAHPRSAWLPDSFGHSGTAPDLLVAAGYDSVAFARIDGAPTLFENLVHPDEPPKPGSTAERLKKLGSADFYWRGPGGGRVLAHYLAGPGLYCTGDSIDYPEKIPIPGTHTGAFRGDDPTYTDAQIDAYIESLRPYAKTPYLFVPVGCDFQGPKERLVEYLDGYNQRRYRATGAWAVDAPFDDYVTLVNAWGDVLPELETDLSPYFMGFYGSRAEVKRRTREAARPFFEAETFAAVLGAEGESITLEAAPALAKLTRADHHDFVTGTSTDDVVAGEQLPLLDVAEQAGLAELARVTDAMGKRIPAPPGIAYRVLALNASSALVSDTARVELPITNGIAPELHAQAGSVPVPIELTVTPSPTDAVAVFRVGVGNLPAFSWRTLDLFPGSVPAGPAQVQLRLLDAKGDAAKGNAVTRVILSNAHVQAEWRKTAGRFALVSLVIDGAEAMATGSFLPRDYTDTGGLWRTGNEMPGCDFTPKDPTQEDESVEVDEATPLAARVRFVSVSATREASLGAGAGGLSLAITTGAAEATTRTVGFSFAAPPDSRLRTSVGAGFLERPLEAVYSPTFWPAVEWVSIGTWAVLLRQSTGVRMSSTGEIELMAARDARAEKCDVLGGTGSDPGTHRIEWRIERVASPTDAARAAQAFNRPIVLRAIAAARGTEAELPGEQRLLSLEGDGIVSAIKPASRGDGLIVRALLSGSAITLRFDGALHASSAATVDLAERDRGPLGLVGTSLALDRQTSGSLVSMRLR